MTVTMKILIVSMMLVGHLAAAAIVGRKMLMRGDGARALIVSGGLLTGWIFAAVMIFTIV